MMHRQPAMVAFQFRVRSISRLQPCWNFFSVLRRIGRTAATKTKPAGRPGRGKCNCTRKIQHYVYIATNTKSKLLVFQKRRRTNRPLPPLPCVFQSRRRRRLKVLVASLPGMQLPTRSQGYVNLHE